VALNHLDQLDLACHALTRTAGFSSRELPTAEDLQGWLPTVNPAWRQDPQGPMRLAQLCAAGSKRSYGLSSLLDSAPSFMTRTGQGWQFRGGTTARKLLRLRLPLGTVHAAAAARAGRPSVGSPPTAIITDDVRYRLRQLGGVDNHVHVGTCLPFDGMFELLQQQVRLAPPRRLQLAQAETSTTFMDSEGIHFQSSHAITAGALLGMLLDSFLSDGTEDFDAFVDGRVTNSRFSEAVLEGRVWSFLHEPDQSRPGGPLWLSGGEELVPSVATDKAPPPANPYHRASQRKLDLLRKIVEGGNSNAYVHCVEDLLRCEALVHFSLIQGNRAGLREFLSVSNRLSRLRHSLPEQSRNVIGHGLPYLSGAMRLSGVELRTAEQFDGHKGVADLVRSLDAKLAGYEDAVAYIDPGTEPPRATWPICLIKTPEMVVDHRKGASSLAPCNLRFDLRPLFDLIHHTADLLIQFPAARKLIPGFDVAGDESAAPSWCFSLLFALFEKRLKEADDDIPDANAVRVHAGEDYYTPLQGLRRIQEAVRWVIPNKPYARIGHALALSPESTQSPDRQTGDQPLDEAFDDLTWAWSRLNNQSGREELVELLAEAITERGAELYGGDSVTPNVYLEAYEQRFNLDALQRLGLLAPSTFRNRLELMRNIDPPASESSADWITYTYLTRSELGDNCGSPLLDEVLLREVADAVRPLVHEAVCQSGSVIEACPTSNLIIGGIDDYQRHPMHRWAEDDQLSLTLNTDDPGLFSVTLADEYVHYWESSQRPVKDRSDAMERMVRMSNELMPSLSSPDEACAAVAEARAEFRAAGMSLPR
jgi:hypothetical protein